MPPPHPPEFRLRAVDLAREGTTPVGRLAKDLGISESCLRNWMAQADADDKGGGGNKLSSAEKKSSPSCGGGTGCWSRRTRS